MKKTTVLTTCLLLFMAFAPQAKSQEWNTGLDIYSSYIWRGSKFGSGPAFQPAVDFSAGGFTIGGWGSVSASTDEALEMDFYASYSTGGLTLTLTDYYFGGDWTEYKTMHALEPSINYSVAGLSLTAAYMFLPGAETQAAVAGSPAVVDQTTGEITPAVEGMEKVDDADFGSSGDMYFEAAYSFSSLDLTLGAGDGQYTSDGGFNICNIGIGTSKEMKLTDSFSLPMSGALILNPSTGGFFITAGISL